MTKKIRIKTSDGTIVHVDARHVSINGMEFDRDDLHFVHINPFQEEAIVRVEFNGKILK